MTINSLLELIINEFGLDLYEKSVNFPKNKINIISIREDPIKIRSIILENEREFHLIINSKKREIFHDCPSFLIHSEKKDKICIHFIKLLLIIKESIAVKILEDLQNLNLTSEDFGSKKKSKNFLILSNSCFEGNINCVEGLSYLNKAIINQCECENIIQTYIETAINNNLFIEFFEFLKNGYENELEEYFLHYLDDIENGFKKFLYVVSDYSFFNLLRIINSIDKILDYKDISFFESLFNKFAKMVNKDNFNEIYFSIYFIKRNYEKLVKLNHNFKDIVLPNQLKSLQKDVLNYFFTEIDNFCVIEKLKLLKKQIGVIGIQESEYIEEYKKYKKEIKELEKKVYRKKFAFLLLLMEKYKIKIARGEFRKKRNTYVVNHDKENLKNPAYKYIIKHLGFYGNNEQTIKSTDIGINFFIFRELFSDDLSIFPDIYYYRKQFWGDLDDFKVNPIEGFSLLSKNIDYTQDIGQTYANINDVMIIEWDLASKPRQGSLVNAYGSQIIIPDQNSPLFHDLKPFDLCYCIRTPVKFEGSIIKKVNVITKCSFNDAIESLSKSMNFIEGYYPLYLVRAVLNKEINPLKANEIVVNNPNKLFVPNYGQFVAAFKRFLFDFINKEKDYIFELDLKSDFKNKSNQLIILLNLTNELTGLDLPYSEILKELSNPNVNLNEFKSIFLNEIHSYIIKVLEEREIGTTIIFNLKKMKNTPFSKYLYEILNIRKEEFETAEVIKLKDGTYNISGILPTYYGKNFSKILKLGIKPVVKIDIFKKIKEFASKLNLNFNVIESNND